MKPETKDKSPLEFWEERYENASGETSGRPSLALERYSKNRPTGTALDLGCAKGDDAVWLAKQSWQVLAVDISAAALKHTAANAARNGVEVRLEQHDLAMSFPSGEFDLISANFLQTPYDFPWVDVIRRAAAAIRPGGLLLAVTHERVAPWSWSEAKLDLPGAEERLADLALPENEWKPVFVGPIDREAKGPKGERFRVRDAVIALERREHSTLGATHV
ncbi:MAG: class I SAM-dependent methyltransferase [Rhodobacteraceae bacterium]|nr:class I SAM-dependent methyltransferase [Paracoccaceae bacterium]